MEHLSQKQVEDYSLHQLPAAELLAVSDHLDECDVCRLWVEEEISSDAAFFALHEETLSENANGTAHLSTAQTADYVDQKLAGESLQVIDDHLMTCDQCVFAVEDLRAFRDQIAPSLEREYRPQRALTTEAGWRQKFASLFRFSALPAFGGAALAVLLLAAIAWMVWRTSRENRQEVVVTPAPIAQPTPTAEPSLAPTPPTATMVAELNDGSGVVSLDQAGKLTGADSLPPAYQSMVKKALGSQRIERSSQLQGLTRPPSSLMGAGNEPKDFFVLEPAGNVLLATQPTFRWSTLAGATGYLVEVYDDQFKLVVSSPQLAARSWTTTQRLARGKVYSWQVKAIKDGEEVTSPRPPAPQAKFRVLDQAKANELAKAKRAYASSHLTLGLLYADAGLLKEAEQEFRLLRRANPNSPLARNLLRQVQSLLQKFDH